MLSFLRTRRRRFLEARPVSPRWVDLLHERVPYYQRLTDGEREILHGRMQVFLEEKHFESVAGFVLQEEMPLIVAAQAVILLLGRDLDYYPRLQSIVIYPETFSSELRHRGSGGIVTEERVRRVGESWQIGTILLSWQQVLRDTALNTGRHVIFHEFAHQIDQADGAADGWPGALDRDQEKLWGEVMGREYAALRESITSGTSSPLDPYGGTKPTEFFATLTETFFLRPRLLHDRYPALYSLFQRFYRQDSLSRFPTL